MNRDPATKKLSLQGDVVETFENDGRRIATIALRSCRIDVALDAIPEAHLGDTIVVDVALSILDVHHFGPFDSAPEIPG